MRYQTHLAGGLATSVALLLIAQQRDSISGLNAPQLFLGSICCLLGSVAPDIDLPTSKISKASGIASKIISFFFGHRTFFHSPLFVLLFYLLLIRLFPTHRISIICFISGYISHIFLDLFNRAGIPLLYPHSKRFFLATIKTGTVAEDVFAGFLYFFSIIGIIIALS